MIFPTAMVGNKGRLFLQAFLWKGFNQLNLAYMKDNVKNSLIEIVLIEIIVSYSFC